MIHSEDITKTPEQLFADYYEWAGRRADFLFRRYGKYDSAADLDDLTQECLIVLNDAAKTWDRKTQPFCAYASMCINRRHINRCRNSRKRRSGTSAKLDDFSKPCNAQDVIDGREYLERMDPMTRQLARLTIGGVLPYAEVAEVMRCSVRTVKRRVKELKDVICQCG